jgi:hypothetical protein
VLQAAEMLERVLANRGATALQQTLRNLEAFPTFVKIKIASPNMVALATKSRVTNARNNLRAYMTLDIMSSPGRSAV